jgi:hypothetical protein
MAVEVLIGDRFGKVVGEVKPQLGPVSWRLNKIGKVDLAFAKTDPKVTESTLQYGNRVLIRFSDDVGLPPWGGTIEPPLSWSSTSVSVSCRSIEYLLQYRRTGKTRAFYGAPVGVIFRQLLQEMETEESIGLRFGQIWMGGRNHFPRYHCKNLWWIIMESLIKLEGCDVRFTPQLADGRIAFLAEMFERLGEDKAGRYAFKERFNVSSATLVEQGPIVNEFMAIGAGSTWGDERPASVALVGESSRRYGLRQDSGIYSSVTEPTTLDRYASEEARQMSRGAVRLELEVVNATPALFKEYEIGDTVRCELPSFGFHGYRESVRVLTREYDPNVPGKCALVVEEASPWEATYMGTGVVEAGETE